MALEKISQKARNIKILILDVDGVLTDGAIIINSDGTETKHFHSHDGWGIKMCQNAGIEVAIISARYSEPTAIRAGQLAIEECVQDCHDKLSKVKDMIERKGLSKDQVAYIGDDLVDLPVIKYVGLGVAVANGIETVKEQADMVTTKTGGKGAVREVVEFILKNIAE